MLYVLIHQCASKLFTPKHEAYKAKLNCKQTFPDVQYISFATKIVFFCTLWKPVLFVLLQ